MMKHCNMKIWDFLFFAKNSTNLGNGRLYYLRVLDQHDLHFSHSWLVRFTPSLGVGLALREMKASGDEM